MAIIYSYPLISELATGDTIAISDVSNGNKTKSVTVGQLLQGQATIIQVDDRVVTGASFNTSSGLLTLTRNGGDIPSVTTNLDGRYALTSSLATVATSGSYNDLSDKPTIPAAYTNADVDTHLNKDAQTQDGYVLSLLNSDYTWVAHSGGGGAVDSVNEQTGAVVLDTDDIDEGTTNLYYTDTRVSANADVMANTAKVGITQEQADAITANTEKVGITTQQASDISTNNAKVSMVLGTTAGTALEGDTVIPTNTSDLNNDSGFIEGTTATETAITEIKTLTSNEYASETKQSNVMYVIV